MPATAVAWGELHLYELPSGDHLWGREFEVLPSGSMFGAEEALHGLIGVGAKPVGLKRREVQFDAPLMIYGVRGTDPSELDLYQDELAELFNAKQVAREA